MASLNGYPLANPHKLGPEWLATGVEEVGIDYKPEGRGKAMQVDTQGEGKTLRRMVIRHDLSVSLVPSSITQATFSQTHSRANSQTHQLMRSSCPGATQDGAQSRFAFSRPSLPRHLPAQSSRFQFPMDMSSSSTRYKYCRAHSTYSQASPTSTAQRSKHVRKYTGCGEQVEYCIARLSEDICFTIRMVSHVQRATDI
jgi:hypothetical protein